MCQVCTAVIIGGLGLSRWLKVDDMVSGVWIGALLIAIIYFTISFLRSKKIRFRGREFIVPFFIYALIFTPLYAFKVIGHPQNQLWGVDKLVIGTFAGSIIFIISTLFYNWLKKINGGRAHFPMEKVAIPVASLTILSTIFYLLTRTT